VVRRSALVTRTTRCPDRPTTTFFRRLLLNRLDLCLTCGDGIHRNYHGSALLPLMVVVMFNVGFVSNDCYSGLDQCFSMDLDNWVDWLKNREMLSFYDTLIFLLIFSITVVLYQA
jgi:hypothetical protein